MRARFLRPLYAEEGGWISVYLDTSRAAEGAADAISLRWRDARNRLEAAGAAAPALSAVARAITAPDGAAGSGTAGSGTAGSGTAGSGTAGSGIAGRAVFARGDRVALSAALAAVPAAEPVRLAPLPHVMPLLAQREVMAAHVRVVATRRGGEVTAVPAGVPAALTEPPAQEVNGPGWPVHKTSVGGWSQDRYQRSAEHAWDENARELAAAVTEAAARISASCLIVAGDARARSLLLHHLGTPLRDEAIVVDREVAADSPELAAAADEALRARAARQARQRLDEWRSLLAHGAAVEGLAATVAALREGLVSELLMGEDAGGDAAVWIGPGVEMALSEAEARERGTTAPEQDRADAGIARAVVRTDAELRFLPPDVDGPLPLDGICAMLRPSGGAGLPGTSVTTSTPPGPAQ